MAVGHLIKQAVKATLSFCHVRQQQFALVNIVVTRESISFLIKYFYFKFYL